jgi:glycosyltransferase involved in cell wall biosynthesis
MAAGVAVVATDVGGVSDLLQGGALGAIVPLDDPSALALAVLDKLSNPHTSEISQRAQDVILQRYTIESSAAQTDTLYKRLLS